MVADIETILNDNNEHIPYAAGFLMIYPEEGLVSQDLIYTFFILVRTILKWRVFQIGVEWLCLIL